jgi:hypothetical protein
MSQSPFGNKGAVLGKNRIVTAEKENEKWGQSPFFGENPALQLRKRRLRKSSLSPFFTPFFTDRFF